MIARFDVHDENDYENATAIVFKQWSDPTAVDRFLIRCKDVGEYRADSVYQRALNGTGQELVYGNLRATLSKRFSRSAGKSPVRQYQ